jgi:magnesium transporter
MLVLTDLDHDRIAAQRERDEFFWLDLSDPSDAELKAAGEDLGLHPLALEDTVEWSQRAKVDTYGDHLLLVFYTARLTDDGYAEPVEVHIYVSGSFVLTVRHRDCTVLNDLHEQLGQTPVEDEGWLVYKILDTLTDAWYPVVHGLEDHIDALEGQVLLRARREQLGVIYRLRQAVRQLGRIAQSQREVFEPATHAIRALPGLQHGTRESFRDVGDHLAQIASELQRQIEDMVALAGMYFNANADRLNAVATRLTVVGTLFVIATIVTGFFGQNFGYLVNHIDTLQTFLIWGVGIPLVLIGAAAALLWFKRRDFF